jgi:high-affinity Fe2+/Pb2+ permease
MFAVSRRGPVDTPLPAPHRLAMASLTLRRRRPARGPLVGITAGVLTSVVLGHLLYRAAVRINRGTFFTWTGVLLVLVVPEWRL